MNVLYLSEEDMVKAGVKDMPRCIDAMEEMFRLLSIGDYRMSGENANSHGARVKFPVESDIEGFPLHSPDRWFTAMPAYLGGKYHMFGIKSYGANHKNAELGLPMIVFMMQLLDIDTGIPLAYMSGDIMSAMRTGAVAGVGARYLAPENPQTLAVLGPGVQSRYALDAIMTVCPEIKFLKVLGRGKKSLDVFLNHCKKYDYKQITVCNSVEELFLDSDIVFTGNTRADSFDEHPYADEQWIKKGSLVIASSAVRYNIEFLNSNRIIPIADHFLHYDHDLGVDGYPVSEEAKKTTTFNRALSEMFEAKKDIVSIGDIIRDDKYVRDPEQTYIYGAYGIPTEDVAWGTECYRNALKMGIGTQLRVWDNSQL